MNTFRVVLEMEVAPGDADEFTTAWCAAAAGFDATPGIVGQSLARVLGEPGHFVVTSDWTDEASFRVFERSPSQDAATATLRRLRRGSTMQTQQVVATAAGSAPNGDEA